jgi:protein-tyrosine phosphatase
MADIIKLDPESDQLYLLDPAAECLRKGGLVAFPTETVYGIAANANDPQTLERLLAIRESPREKYLTIHIADEQDVIKHVQLPIPNSAHRLMRKFWPGPLTIVFPTRDERGIGLRFPNHKIACALIKKAEVPIVAPSANLSGKPPAYEVEPIIRDFSDRLDYIIDSGPTRYKISSTVVRAFTPKVEILREGAIPRDMIIEYGYVSILFICTGNTCRSPIAEAMFKKLIARKYGFVEDELELRGFRISSAGTAATAGAKVAEQLENAVKEAGFTLMGHLSQPVTIPMVEEADYVFTMTQAHINTLKEWCPESSEKIQLLDPEGSEIDDPLGGTLESYRDCIKKIQSCIMKRLKEF